MKINVGTVDRVIRVVVATVLFFLAFSGTATGVWAWIAGIVGAILLATGALGRCSIYALLGINTSRKE